MSSRTAALGKTLWSDKLFHTDLNGQRGITYDQGLVFAHGDLTGVPDGPRYTGPKHFDYKPSRTEHLDGVRDLLSKHRRPFLLWTRCPSAGTATVIPTLPVRSMHSSWSSAA